MIETPSASISSTPIKPLLLPSISKSRREPRETGLPTSLADLPQVFDDLMKQPLKTVSYVVELPMQFYSETGFAGGFPASFDGGVFIWLSRGQAKPKSGRSERRSGLSRVLPEGYGEGNPGGLFIHRVEILPVKQTVEGTSISESEAETEYTSMYTCKPVDERCFTETSRVYSAWSQLKALLQGKPSKNQDKRFILLADFPFGPYRGHNARPVLFRTDSEIFWEIDGHSLAIKQEHRLVDYCRWRGGQFGGLVSKPVYFESELMFLIGLKGEGNEGNYSKYQLISVSAGKSHIIATFMGPVLPDSTCLPSLLAVDKSNIVIAFNSTISDQHADTLFYVISKIRGALVTVYKSERCFITQVIPTLHTNQDELIFKAVVFESVDAFNEAHSGEQGKSGNSISSELREYRMKMIMAEVARFEGSAGLLDSFAIADFMVLQGDSINWPVQLNDHQLIVASKEGSGPWWTGLLNLQNNQTKISWTGLTGSFLTQPLPITTTGSSQLLLTLLMDTFHRTSFLLFLDSSDLQPIGRIWLPQPINLNLPTNPIWLKHPHQ